jgi:TonB family protein
MSLLLADVLPPSLVILIAWAGTIALRRRSAALRHWLWATAIVCAAALPVLAPIAPTWPARLAYLSITASSTDRTQSRVDGSTADTSTPPPTPVTGSRAGAAVDPATIANSGPRLAAFAAALPSSMRLIRAIYIAGVALNLCVLCAGLGRLAWLATRARRLRHGPSVAMAHAVAREYGVRRAITMLESDHPSLLMTWGHLHPKVLLPASAAHWSEARLRIVLGHELAHIRRSDWATQLIAEVVRCCYWFNPLLWIACRRLRVESEQACDDMVLRAGIDGPVYARHVLELAREHGASHRALAAARAMAVEGSELTRRIDAMLNPRLDRTPITRAARLGIAVALFLITLPVAGLGARQPASRLSGVITDPSGTVVANADVSLTDTQTQTSRQATSDARGYFEYAGLAVGDYFVEVQVPGFAPRKLPVRIESGEQTQRNIRLRLGSVTETIVVAGAGRPRMDAGDTGRQAEPAASRVSGRTIDPPTVVTRVLPDYPGRLHDAGVRGSVTLEGVIGKDGAVTNLEVLPPANEELARATLDAVRQWRYEPTRLHGVPVDVTISITVDFQADR